MLSGTAGIVGCAGLQPTVAAIREGKHICLANKETLIAGGPYVLPLAAQYGVNLLPADSEHSAIFQCIQVAGPTLFSQSSGNHCRDLVHVYIHRINCVSPDVHSTSSTMRRNLQYCSFSLAFRKEMQQGWRWGNRAFRRAACGASS